MLHILYVVLFYISVHNLFSVMALFKNAQYKISCYPSLKCIKNVFKKRRNALHPSDGQHMCTNGCYERERERERKIEKGCSI